MNLKRSSGRSKTHGGGAARNNQQQPTAAEGAPQSARLRAAQAPSQRGIVSFDTSPADLVTMFVDCGLLSAEEAALYADSMGRSWHPSEHAAEAALGASFAALDLAAPEQAVFTQADVRQARARAQRARCGASGLVSLLLRGPGSPARFARSVALPAQLAAPRAAGVSPDSGSALRTRLEASARLASLPRTDKSESPFPRQPAAATYPGFVADALLAFGYSTDREGEATDSDAQSSGRSGGSDSAHDTVSDADWRKETMSGVAQRAHRTTLRAAVPAAQPAAAVAAQVLQLRFVNGEDGPLAQAVADHRGPPNKKSPNGIKWRAINREVMAGNYGAVLQARVTSLGSKVLSKRWWLICPQDYPNRSRKIR